MAHDHNHDHGSHNHSHAGHSHAPASFGKAFAIGIALNTVYVIAEAAYGIASNSLALVADAGHNLSDVLGLALAWGASILTARAPKGRYTYGLRKTSILAALTNAVVLLVVTGGIIWEAIRRFSDPQIIDSNVVIFVALIGIFVNGFTAFMFMSGRKNDINIKGAFLHMVADAAITLGVVIAALLIKSTGWAWIDPAISVIIGVVITIGTWSLFRDSVFLALDAIPSGIEKDKIESYLSSLPGVTGISDLHIWGLSTTETALTAHLIRPGSELDDAFIKQTAETLKLKFGIAHATIQIENGDEARMCALHTKTV